ncbi:hypothetical protein THAR02_10076 [Trichoderma harzianum]|uniref:NAD(P)-binding domain-containing protein n=1 Tax=Trichoderma harzianum TaxID=5544 RepID=A0A0F9XAR9_TRIHA|nr:hypothetical protein THAR02_10076 [Trichoderma harzianum]
MAPSYAKDQPAGQIGKHIAEELVKTGKHAVTAISRVGSKSPLAEGVKVTHVDYANEQYIVDALKDQQFLFISLAVTAPPDTQDKLVKAAAQAGVPWVMLNGYGTDPLNEKLGDENFNGKGLRAGIKSVEDAGFSSWVLLTTSFCGRAAAALVSLKVLPEDENDKSVTLSQWRNKPVYVASFLVSQRDILGSVQRVTGTTDKDWEISYQPSKERWKNGVKALKEGNRQGFARAMYSRTHFPNGDGNLQDKYGLANDALGLPKEDFDEATKRAVGMLETRYDPHARAH